MKITVKEAVSKYPQFSVGPVKVKVEDAFQSSVGRKGVSVPITVEIPLKHYGDSNWDRETFIGGFELEAGLLEDILKEQFREIVGTALFNANRVEILKDKYSLGTFAKWEAEMLADQAGIDALQAYLQKQIDGFKPEEA